MTDRPDASARAKGEPLDSASEERPSRLGEESFRATFEQAAIGRVLTRLDGRLERVNRAMAEMLGYSIEELEARAFVEVTHPDDRARSLEQARRLVEGEADARQFEKRYLHRDGHVVWTNVNATVVRDEEGRPLYFVTDIVDITARKRAEEALQREKERAQTYLDLAGVMMIALDAEGRVTLANRRASEILGYRPDELLGKDWFATCLPRDRGEQVRKVFRQLLTGQIEPVEHHENSVITKSGQERVIVWHNALLTDETGRVVGTLSSGEDITDRQRAAEQLQVSQRLEAVGLLAGGVAHDFNNLLTVIDGFASCALDSLHASDPIRDYLGEIRTASERAAGLTRQLLAFSRKQVLEPRVLQLNDVVTSLKSMLGRLLGEHIEVAVRLGAELGHVRADPGQLEQVIVNLAVNARDAMPTGGKLTISTANVTLDETLVAPNAEFTPGPHVLLSVSDTGCGMSAEVRRRIFEPFFTTKDMARGTGLGLSTVYGIVRQSGGSIWVYSELGLGTTFRIYLPRVAEPTTVEQPAAPLPSTAGHESVLVVEDDEAVRRLSARILQQAGYRVETAANGDEALRACELPGASYDLLLTDVVMPRMGGRELAEQIVRAQPAIRVLYTSGYPDGAIVEQGDLLPGTHFIGKPFSAHELRRKVREALDAAPTPAETRRGG